MNYIVRAHSLSRLDGVAPSTGKASGASRTREAGTRPENGL